VSCGGRPLRGRHRCRGPGDSRIGPVARVCRARRPAGGGPSFAGERRSGSGAATGAATGRALSTGVENGEAGAASGSDTAETRAGRSGSSRRGGVTSLTRRGARARARPPAGGRARGSPRGEGEEPREGRVRQEEAEQRFHAVTSGRELVHETSQLAELVGREATRVDEVGEERRHRPFAEGVRRVPQPARHEVLSAEARTVDVLPSLRAVRDVPLVLEPLQELLHRRVLGGPAVRVDRSARARIVAASRSRAPSSRRAPHPSRPGASCHADLLPSRHLRRYV